MIRYLIILALFTACTTVNERTETWTVGSQLVDCAGVAPMQCMQIKRSPNADWEMFYDQIDGFNYEEGFVYTIEVTSYDIKNPPADASSKGYRLVEILEKEEAIAQHGANEQSGTPRDAGLFGVTWKLLSYRLYGNERILRSGQDVTFQADEQGMMFTGQSTCNKYFGQMSIDGSNIKFGRMGMTQKACPDNTSNGIELDYMKLLEIVETFEIDNDGNLQLISGSTGSLTFEASGYR